MRLPPFNPYIAVVIGVLSISTTAILVKLADSAPVAIIANYRLLFAFIIMAPIAIIKYRHELQYIRKKDWILLILSGVFLATHFILWFESLNYTSVASSVVLISLQPILAFLGTYLFFQERFSSGSVISIFIVLFGSFLIGFSDFQISAMTLFGDVLAILGAITVTFYYILGKRTRAYLSLVSYTFIAYGIGAITLVFYNVFQGNSFLGYPTDHWWIFLALAVFPTFFGHMLFNWSLKWLSSSTVSMGNIFKPIGATILAFLILGEQVNSFQLLGGTIIIFGLFLFIVSTSRKRKVTISHSKKQ